MLCQHISIGQHIYWDNCLWNPRNWWAKRPVHKIKCEVCEAVHVGETDRSLHSRFNKLQRSSSTTSEVTKHIHVEQPHHSVELDNTEFLKTESRWFERVGKEAIYIRALNPSLNRDGGRYNVPPSVGQHHEEESEGRPDWWGRGAGRVDLMHHRHAQHPQQHLLDDRTEEDESHYRKL